MSVGGGGADGSGAGAGGSGAGAGEVLGGGGAGMGLAYIRTNHHLATGVAMHVWYDTLLSAIAFAADPEHQSFVVNDGTSM